MVDERIREHEIVLVLCPEEFEMSGGRRPKSQEEFDEWAHLAEKGLLNGHIDWGIVYECAAEAFLEAQGGAR